MSSSSNKYYALKSSLSCALKKKRVLIPFFVETNFCQMTPLNQGVPLSIVCFNKKSVDSLSFGKQSENLICLSKNSIILPGVFKLVGQISKDCAFNSHTDSSCQPLQKVSLPLSRTLHHDISLNTSFLQKNYRVELDALYCNASFGITLLLSQPPISTEDNTEGDANLLYPFKATRYAGFRSAPDLNSDRIKKDCTLIRPLLDLSRSVIMTICQYGKIPVYPDRSNQNVYYSRNRIRKQIIPSIQLFINPQAENALFQFSELVLQERDFISRLIRTTRE